jgi:hypothetical protein
VGGVSWTNDVPHIEHVHSFLKKKLVEQPVIFANVTENQYPWYIHIFNNFAKQEDFHLNIAGGVSWTNEVPYIEHVLS